MTGDSLSPEQPPSGPLYAPESHEPPAIGISRRPGVASGPQAGSQGFGEPEWTEEERDDLIDLLPKDMILWPDDEELSWFPNRNYDEWRDILGHPRAHRGCCKTCGCAITCTLGAFHDSVISSVVRELARLGALRQPTPADPSGSPDA